MWRWWILSKIKAPLGRKPMGNEYWIINSVFCSCDLFPTEFQWHFVCAFHNSPYTFCVIVIWVLISFLLPTIIKLSWEPRLAPYRGVGHIRHLIGVCSIKFLIVLLDSMGIKTVPLWGCVHSWLFYITSCFDLAWLSPINYYPLAHTYQDVVITTSAVSLMLLFSYHEMNSSFINIDSLTWFPFWPICRMASRG